MSPFDAPPARRANPDHRKPRTTRRGLVKTRLPRKGPRSCQGQQRPCRRVHTKQASSRRRPRLALAFSERYPCGSMSLHPPGSGPSELADFGFPCFRGQRIAVSCHSTARRAAARVAARRPRSVACRRRATSRQRSQRTVSRTPCRPAPSCRSATPDSVIYCVAPMLECPTISPQAGATSEKNAAAATA